MQILGVGTDIVEIERIANFCRESSRFQNRVFTEGELEYCRGKVGQHAHLAARFAGKEAVAKAFGEAFGWHEVEIYTEESGKPGVRLSGKAAEVAGNRHVLISLSHSRDYATAVAILVGD